MAKILLSVCLCSAAWVSVVGGQASDEPCWIWSAHFTLSLAVNETDWAVRHPVYGGGNVTWETLSGTVYQGFHAQVGIELRKGRIGLRGTLGALPQELTQEAPARGEEFTLLLGGLSVVFYPRAGTPGRVQPYLQGGAGGQKATGDLDNTGFYLSGAAGVRTSLTSRVSLEGGVQVLRLKYTQVDLGNNIQKDLTTHPVSLFLGVRLRGMVGQS